MTSKDRDTHDTHAPADADGLPPLPREASPPPLDDALHLLQADPGHSLADPGLARLAPAGLDRLFLAARRQAERNYDGILLLLDLLHLAQRAEDAGHRRLLTGVVRQLRHHVEDQQRWQALADNAAYYRDNRQVAERVAARLPLG
ncbi:hypothetical protein [Pseudoxanthomonas sp.]|jgi:hypothetical protein|uniref:hypothetical protein n=1 Tax=Pseudoxanthomonas sp. TaxID=1871049 RepID=UPI002E14A4F5|nr:hypothetical protein [Pseudoxanthomonas sp.]